MSTSNSTTLARLADRNWSTFCVEAGALADELRADTPALSVAEAGSCAAAQVDALLAYAEAWDVATRASRRAAAERRAAERAQGNTAAGCIVRRTASGAFLVSSASVPGVIYVVGADLSTCTCKAGSHHVACWHVQAAAQHLARQIPARAA